MLRAAQLMLNEQSNLLTGTEKPTTSNADLPDRGPHRTQARQPRVHFYKLYHVLLHVQCMSVWHPRDRTEIEDSYGQHIRIITEIDVN